MNANYKQRGIPPSAGFIMGMSAKEARAWDMTEAYRMREYDAIATAMIMSILYYLATKEKDPHDAVSLRQDWEGMVRVRAEARAALRELSSGADYTLMATGKNVEDYYMMEEPIEKRIKRAVGEQLAAFKLPDGVRPKSVKLYVTYDGLQASIDIEIPEERKEA